MPPTDAPVVTLGSPGPIVTLVAPGAESSEYKLSKYVAIIGSFLVVAGTVLASLSQFGIGGPWVGVAIAVVGALMKIVNSLGYTAQRTDLKQAAMEAGVAASSGVTTPAQALAALAGQTK